MRRGEGSIDRVEIAALGIAVPPHERAANATNPADYVILPEVISKEPLGPVVRKGDDQFADVVRWTLFAMIEAEELGITSKNVDEMLISDNPSIKRVLGVTPGMGRALGVDEKWVCNIVKQVGNYGEAFALYLGPWADRSRAKEPPVARLSKRVHGAPFVSNFARHQVVRCEPVFLGL